MFDFFRNSLEKLGLVISKFSMRFLMISVRQAFQRFLPFSLQPFISTCFQSAFCRLSKLRATSSLEKAHTSFQFF